MNFLKDYIMKKSEALNYIRLCKGYVPYITIFDIFNDTEEIPQELIDLSIKEDKTRGNFIICNAQVAEHFRNLKL
jgi:hypothetical protein